MHVAISHSLRLKDIITPSDQLAKVLHSKVGVQKPGDVTLPQNTLISSNLKQTHAPLHTHTHT